MIFHFGVLLFSLIFFGMLTWLVREPIVPSWTWYSAATFVFIVLSVIASRKLTGKWYPAYLPSVVSFSALLLLSLIDVVFEQKAFIVVATVLFYATLLGIYRIKISSHDETARSLLSAVALASLFFTYAAAYGLYLNYAVPLSVLMLVFFFATVIVAFQTLFWVGKDDTKQVFLSSLALGAMVGELIWVMHFWPFSYLTIGAVMLIFFYVLWRMALDVLRGTVTLKKILWEGFVLILLLILLLLTSPWRLRA